MALLILSLALASVVSPDTSLFDAFWWSSAVVLGRTNEKASMLVPIEIPGARHELYAQLDTGSDATIFYGKALRAHGIAVDSSGAVPVQFRWYGHGRHKSPLETPALLNWEMGDDIASASADPRSHVVGTVGLDMVTGKILILDFPRRRYAVISDTLEISRLVPEPIGYAVGQIAYNKFFVSVEMDGDTLEAVRYDTGASAFTLVMPRDWWQWATGLTGKEAAVARDTIQSWGQGIEAWTAPARYDLRFGEVQIATPQVSYIAWPDPDAANMRIMGNAPFYDDYVVVLDCIREKFGVAKSGPSPNPKSPEVHQ